MFALTPLDDPALTLPLVLTTTAINNAERTFCVQVDGDDVQPVTWAKFMEDVKSVAAHLKQVVETVPSKDGPPAIALLANGEYVYALNTIAIIMNGWIALPLSLRMSPDGISNLLRTSHACHLLTDPQSSDTVKALTVPVNVSNLVEASPSLTSDWAPLTSSCPDAPALYMHTSGSSGQPRLVPWTHRFCLAAAKAAGREYNMLSGEVVLYTMAPLYHAMGVFSLFTIPITLGAQVVFHTLHAPLHMDTFLPCLRKFEKTFVISIPYILTEIHAAGPDAMRELAKHTSLMAYGGAPLDPAVGDDLVAHGVRIAATYGSTEVGLSTIQMPQEGGVSGEWEYFTVREGYGYKMLDLNRQDNAKELLILAAEDTPALCNHSDPRGYLTGDIFYSHPTLPNFFKHAGRKTGMTILENGEKVDNYQIESILLKDNRVAHAAVFGSGHFQIGVLLQPAFSDDNASFIDSIWPIIQSINKIVPRHARIVRPLVLITKNERPFSLTPKGTTKGWETLEGYAAEIKEAYVTLDSRGVVVDFPGVFDQAGVSDYVRALVRKALGYAIADDADFFSAGMDSLQVSIVRSGANALLNQFGKSFKATLSDIYTWPSVAGITQQLLSFEAGATDTPSSDISSDVRSIIERYGVIGPRSAPASKETVVLTGSSGSLGVFLLHELLRKPEVEVIYCFSRSHTDATALQRHQSAFRLKGLDCGELADPRINFLYVDLSRADLGLDHEVYDKIRVSVTRIIHSAWQLDFNMALRSFELPHIAGVRHLADLAMKSPKTTCPRLVFISSIAAYLRWEQGSAIPEEYVDLPPPLEGGYGQSKYAAEKLLIHLQQQGGLNVSIIRVGQLSGASTNGSWSATEYMPVIFNTSSYLELFPIDLRPVRWLPVDVAAKAIATQAFREGTSPLEYFNVDNIDTTEWSEITKMISRMLQNSLRPVSMTTWLQQAETKLGDGLATRLAPFLLDLAEKRPDSYLDVTKSRALCPELAYGPVTFKLLSKYLSSLGISVSDE